MKLQEPFTRSVGHAKQSKKRTTHAIAESFLKFSPRVVYRIDESVKDEAASLWLFIDIASTSHLFSGEEELAREACLLSQDLGFGVQWAISDTPAGAQAFATAYPNTICQQGEEREGLKKFSLPLLLHLEGVRAWEKPSQVESILTFFMMVGFKTAADLSKLSALSFQERWGQTGLLLWKRLNASDRAVISPLSATEPLEDYVHLDFPISLTSLLLRHSEKSLDYLFARLQGRRLFAKKLVMTFHCEYSNARHRIEIEPNTPSRDQELFTTLLENRLDGLNLDNPIRDFEVHVIPGEERAPQMDFFEPRESHADKLQTLFSLLLQSSVKPGLFELQKAIMPEDSWELVQELDQSRHVVRPEDVTIKRQQQQQLALLNFSGGSVESYQQSTPSFPQDEGVLAARDAGAVTRTSVSKIVNEQAVAYEPRYGDTVEAAPRPTRLLAKPMPLTIEELERLKILSSTPIERLEHAWWDDDDDSDRNSLRRDYYFAVSTEGQCLWIFQDLMTDEYFLHGYFD